MTAADPHAPPGRRSRRGGTLGPVSLALTRHHAVVNVMTAYDVPDDFETSQVELDLAERGLGALIEACERAAEGIGGVIRPAPPRINSRQSAGIDEPGRPRGTGQRAG